MEHINSVISENLRRLREERKLSLDATAKLSGVSKSMLGQIERGDVNPTVSTVWKIANGFKVSPTDLMIRLQEDTQLVRRADVPMVAEDGGRYRNYPIFPFDPVRRFEMYEIEMDPGAHLEAEAHPDGTQELITVFAGCLTVSVNNEKLTAPDGSSLRFRADRPHAYDNNSGELCRMSMVIYFPQTR